MHKIFENLMYRLEDRVCGHLIWGEEELKCPLDN